MPCRIRKVGDRWVVQKVVGGSQKQVGSHDTPEKARRQLTALRIAEAEERRGR